MKSTLFIKLFTICFIQVPYIFLVVELILKKKGGDIDLFIDLDYHLNIKNMLELKRKFKMKLYTLLGEQKIDIVVSKDKNRSIEQEILQTGVLL